MGVTGSHCQLCRLPLHHDHYVPDATGTGMLKIYRTGSPDTHDFAPGDRVVTFGSEHAWLCDAVAVPRVEQNGVVLRGTVEDGVLTDRDSGATSFIWEGDDEAMALHHWCWQRLGSPTQQARVVTGAGLHAWAVVETYAGQLFEHAEFIEHGFAWMLDDPEHSERSRSRIDALIAHARNRPASSGDEATSVRDLVVAERSWRGFMGRDGDGAPRHHIRYRHDLHPELDVGSYPALVWAMKEYGSPGLPPADMLQRMVEFETVLIGAVEASDAAVCVMTTLGVGQTQYLVQARDEAATRAVIESLPSPAGTKPIDFDNESDPAWSNFFDKMMPRRGEN